MSTPFMPLARSRLLMAASSAAIFYSGQANMDCFQGMSNGRPEAWHLACCDVGWSHCWNEEFTKERCCHQREKAETSLGVEVLSEFLNFGPEETQLFLQGLKNAMASPAPAPPLLWHGPGRGDPAFPAPPPSNDSNVESPRFPCHEPLDCAREGFARFYKKGFATNMLPLRHPWLSDPQDHLFALGLKMREENDGWAPRGHEHTLERIQAAEFLSIVSERIKPEKVPGERRCLNWDSRTIMNRFFKKHCGHMDILTYQSHPSEWRAHESDTGSRTYVADIHHGDAIIPAESVGLVVAMQVFEHIRTPHVAMRQIFRILAPGGYFIWSAPLFSETHGSPEDYWRFTRFGAQALAADTGFTIHLVYAPGDLRELAGYYLGITGPYWKKEDILADSMSSWNLQVYMLLQKPLPGRNRTYFETD